MEEEIFANAEGAEPSEGAKIVKRRGRKPKAESSAEAASEPADAAPKKRGRPRKAKADEAEKSEHDRPSGDSNKDLKEEARKAPANFKSGPSWRDDAPAAAAPEAESYGEDSEAEIFVHRSEGDDFAFNREDDSPEAPRERDGDAPVPTSFSTTDEDLEHDTYSGKEEREEVPADSESFEGATPVQPSEQGGEQHRQWQQNRNQQNRGDRQNNFRNQNQQNRGNQQNRQNQQNNFRNQNQPNRNGQQNNFRNQNQQNRNGQQNRQNPNQNRQNPQNQNRQNQNQQNRQNLNLKQKKPRWMQNQNSEEDVMNPADLPEWNAMKSQAALDEYLAQAFFGKAAPAAESAVETPRAEEPTPAPEAAAQDAELSEKAESAPEVPEVKTEIPAPAEPEKKAEENADASESPSYWALMNSINKDLQPKVREHFGENKAEAEKPAAPEVPKAAPMPVFDPTFVESKTLSVPEGGELEALEGFDDLYGLQLRQLQEKFDELGVPYRRGVGKSELFADYFRYAAAQKKLVRVSGVLDVFEDGFGGAITYAFDSYKLRRCSVYVPQMFIERYGLHRGHIVSALAMPPRIGGKENCPVAVKITGAMGTDPENIRNIIPFTDLTPYYPTRRMIMEADAASGWDNLSMRTVDLLTPVGLGQRALIVAPPRTGKTVLMQGMAKSIRRNTPDAHLIILLVDERPEEVTDFRRSVDAEVIASTFDEEAQSHVHAAEMVISKARRMVECGKNVVILLDSITRLARAYNAMMPNGGRTMSGGVEANALQKPKKFFGSARNIEGGGSLTIIGTALVETGSKMDEVIFEEFKGTGNLELHLDRALSDKRIFPSINMEKSGTRKEELLYHPEELSKIYALRRAMKGVPAADAMEMLVQRLKKVKTNVEFLLGLNR